MNNKIQRKNDINDNDVPDAIDRAIAGYVIWESAKAILLIIAIYIFLKVLGSL